LVRLFIHPVRLGHSTEIKLPAAHGAVVTLEIPFFYTLGMKGVVAQEFCIGTLGAVVQAN